MKKLVFTITFLLLGLQSVLAQQSGTFTRSELVKYKSDLEVKLKHNLKEYLGDIKFSVFTTIDSRKVKAKTNQSDLFLLGVQDSTEEEVRIHRVQAKVMIFESLNKAFDKEVENIVNYTAEPFQVDLKISYIESTRYYSEQLKNHSDDSLSFLQKLLKNNSSEIINLIGLLLLAIVGLFGVVILARLLKGPLNLIAESFKDLANKNVESKVEKEDDFKKTPELTEPEMQEISLKFKDNLKILKEIIMQKPSEIGEVINKSDKDAAGVKKVIPYIYEKKYIESLKAALPLEEFKKVNEASYRFDTMTDFFQWFNSTIESLSITSLTVSWAVVEKLPSEMLHDLLKVPSDFLVEYAHERKETEVYQVVIDLLNGGDKEKFTGQLDIDVWKQIVKSNDLESLRIHEIAKDILEKSSASNQSLEIVSAQKVQDSVIIPTLLNILPYKPLKIQDDFLASLGTASSDVVEVLRERFWTPRNLLRVPKDNLVEAMRNYSVEEKVKLLAVMPEDVKNYLFELLPAGKVKVVVEDRLKSNSDSDIVDEKTAKAFIETIFSDYQKGLFSINKMILEPKTSAKTSVVDDDDFDFDLDDEDDQDFDVDDDVA